MNKRIITTSIVLICFALFVSCNREDDPSNPNNDIYIAGAYGEYTNRPVLLKNLSKVTLDNGSTGQGWCLDIFVK